MKLTLSLLVAALALLPWTATAAKLPPDPVECHLPDGRVAVLSRLACRDQVGLVLRSLREQERPQAAPLRSPKQLGRALAARRMNLEGIGSGFFVSKNGTVLTNEHVTNRCDALWVQSGDGLQGAAAVSATDPASDMALVRTSLKPSRVAAFRTGPRLRVGDAILAAGYPDGGSADPTPIITRGNVRWLPSDDNDSISLATTATLLPGSSGGPLLDASGNVVGVNFMIVVDGRAARPGYLGDLLESAAIQSSAAEAFLRRQRVAFARQPSRDVLSPRNIARRAQLFTVRIFCLRDS